MTAASVKAVVFDMDGVLTNTEEVWDEVRRGLAREHGLAWPDDATVAMMGMSTPEWAGYLVERVGFPGDAEATAREVIEAMAARYHSHLPINDGAADAVLRVADARPVALVSSSPRLLIDTVVGELGLDGVFDATVSTEEVAAGKPAPDGYLRGCELLGVEPSAAVAVEDSNSGVRSAAGAGLRVVAFPDPSHPLHDEVAALVSAVISGLDELTEDLLARLPGRPRTPGKP